MRRANNGPMHQELLKNTADPMVSPFVNDILLCNEAGFFLIVFHGNIAKYVLQQSVSYWMDDDIIVELSFLQLPIHPARELLGNYGKYYLYSNRSVQISTIIGRKHTSTLDMQRIAKNIDKKKREIYCCSNFSLFNEKIKRTFGNLSLILLFRKF